MTFPDTLGPLWSPHPEIAQRTRMARLMQHAGYACYEDLWQWSVDHPEAFWRTLWNESGVAGTMGSRILDDPDRMPGARWFPDARLNYAENLLQHAHGEALVFWGEDKVQRRWGHGQLRREVSRFQSLLREAGVGEGDRVAGYLPNLPETLAAMLATTALGAIWSSASPDFGVQGVLDRFGQIEPKVLVCVDGYWYNGKAIDCMEKNAEVAKRLPSLERTVVVPYLSDSPELGAIPAALAWNRLPDPPQGEAAPAFRRVPFNHPLFIMFSSGTTGVPKCIVHGHGGVLLQHLKEHQLHSDVRPGDRLFYFTTCGWMMWNWLASGLASGATLLLYDGSPFAGRGQVLFEYAQAERMTHFGTSAKFIDAAAKLGLSPGKTHDLTPLRALFSTGSPLAPESFDWVYRELKADILLASISGGTDIISCFVLGNPLLPVYRGEIQCRGLGMAVDVFDEEGHPVRGEKGELVCTRPFPVMPLGFWNDPDGKKYRAAYFERFPGVWCHGDYCELTPHGGIVIYGRSDATLNPGGVRIGTAEIYRQVEQLPEVVESIVIGQDWPPGRHDDVRVVLFVKLQPGLRLDTALEERIRKQIRANTTPRHVPEKIVQVQDIPRTKSGKIVELAVRNIVHNRPVKNVDALANPEALEYFRGLAALSH